MGLDQNLYRRYEPKSTIDKTIKALDFKDDNEYEEVLYWRKDYLIHSFFQKHFEVENCRYIRLTKEILVMFKEFLRDNDGISEEKYEEGEDLEENDYQKEITKLNEIILNYDFEDYVYYYWGWW